MSVFALVVVGLVTALAVSAVMPANEPRALLITMALGVIGAVLGGFVSVALGIGTSITAVQFQTIIVAAVPALVLMLGYRSLTGTRRLRI